MSAIDIKLKKDASREKLTTVSGYEITKSKYIVVDDDDKDIQRFIRNRNDLLIKENKKTSKSNSKPMNTENFKE